MPIRSAFVALVILALPTFSLAQGKSTAAVKSTAVYGMLLGQSTADNWESLPANAEIEMNRLLVVLFGAELRSLNGAVEAKLLADVGQRGPFPVLEAAVRFHGVGSEDMSVTLERGILVLINTKKAGAAHVQLRVSDEVFKIELHEPKAKVGIEVYGRHVRGMPNLSSAKANAPVVNAAFFALEGEVLIHTEKHATRLQAPPGPTLYLWDNLTRMPEVHRLETLPDSAKPMSPEERKKFGKIAGLAKAWSEKGPYGPTVEKALGSSDPAERKAAVVALGALDELPRLVQALSNKDHADVRDMTILAIRHWLGRAPGQSIRLFEHLTKKEGYTPTQAKNLLYLFNGIEDEKLRQAETFDLLIGALNHAKMPTRELARWHLVRLVPEGKAIPYDAAAVEPMRLQAIAAWRRLIPEGEVPAPPKKTGME